MQKGDVAGHNVKAGDLVWAIRRCDRDTYVHTDLVRAVVLEIHEDFAWLRWLDGSGIEDGHPVGYNSLLLLK